MRKKGIIVYGLIKALMGLSGLIKKVFKVNIGKKMFGFLLKNLSRRTTGSVSVAVDRCPPPPSRCSTSWASTSSRAGLTETSRSPTSIPSRRTSRPRWARRSGTEVKIVDPDSDGNGIIHIKGPMVMQGYYNNPEATAEVLEDGWLNTGDVGYQDSEGYLYLTGRAKNLIVTEGGKNVFPEEIEDYFQLYNEIETICVLGYIVDKKTKSEGIRALIYPAEAYTDAMEKEHGKASKAKIEERMDVIVSEVNRKLQSYKKITRTTVVDEPLEMTSTKKVKRYIVAQKYKD